MSWLLTDVTQLQGTIYFEFLPGRYAGKCRRPGSVFLTEEAFAHIEPIFNKHRPDFAPYGFVDIARSQWRPILADLSATEAFLASDPTAADVFKQVGFLTAEDKDTFGQELKRNTSQLRSTIAQLLRWIQTTLESNDAISVLGL